MGMLAYIPCMWRPEVDDGRLPLLFFGLICFEPEAFVELRAHCFSYAGHPMNRRTSLCPPLPSPGITAVCPMPSFSMGAGDLNPGPRAYAASTSPSESLPQPSWGKHHYHSLCTDREAETPRCESFPKTQMSPNVLFLWSTILFLKQLKNPSHYGNISR